MTYEPQESLVLINHHIGKQLQKRREKWDMSRKDLGKYLGVSYQQVQKYEAGANVISAAKLFKACYFLECEIGYFFHHIHRENPALALDFPEYDDISVSVSSEMLEVMEYWEELDFSFRSHVLSMLRILIDEFPKRKAIT